MNYNKADFIASYGISSQLTILSISIIRKVSISRDWSCM